MDRIDAISLFLEIADRGSLTAAAESTERSLPTVVRTLAALEQQLGIKLFNRTTRTLSLTEEGRIYRRHALIIQAAVADSERAVGLAQAEPMGTLTVTAPVKFGELHVAPLLCEFLRDWPKIQINLLLLDRIVNLVEEGIDVAVRIAHLPDSELIAKHVADIRQVIVASPELILKHGAPTRPEDLAALPCIRSAGIGEAATWDFQVEKKPVRVNVQGNLYCNQIGGAIAACHGSVGFGRLLHYQVLPSLKSGLLKTVLEEFELPARALSLVYPSNRQGSIRISTFVRWLDLRLRERLEAVALS